MKWLRARELATKVGRRKYSLTGAGEALLSGLGEHKTALKFWESIENCLANEYDLG